MAAGFWSRTSTPTLPGGSTGPIGWFRLLWTTLGSPGDAAVSDPALSGSLTALAKGVLLRLPVFGGRLLVSNQHDQPLTQAQLTQAGLATTADLSLINNKIPSKIDNALPVRAKNTRLLFRDDFSPLGQNPWTVVLGSGDIVYRDGNTAGTRYLVVSKNPLTPGTETTITLTSGPQIFAPFEITFQVHTSQRTLGQEFSCEIVDTATPTPNQPDLTITSISQTGNTLVITTSEPHGLTIGRAFGVMGVPDSRLNYPALVVSSIVSPTQFTAGSGPGGAIPSQALSGSSGFVYQRWRLGRAVNGMSMIFENPTATNASFYIRANGQDPLPSGILTGNHSTTVGTTASVALAGSQQGVFAFAAANDSKVLFEQERIQFSDLAVDALTAPVNRYTRTQQVPDPNANYTIRVRAVNNKSLTVPNAQVVSVTKSGSTTGTFVTDVPHSFITGDLIVYYGSSDSAAANFPNLVTATAITVTGSNTFTATIGTGTTGTAYGGFVARVQGGNLMSALGVTAQNIINATLSTLPDGKRQLVLTGSASWSGPSIGDLVNVIGARSVAGLGASLGVDGPWQIFNIATTVLTLVSLPDQTWPADFALTTCGGSIIKRTDLRVSLVAVYDYDRHRVEFAGRPSNDIAKSLPAVITNVPAVTQSGTWTVGLGVPAIATDLVSAALTTTTTTIAFTPASGSSYIVSIPVTAVTGTNPTLDFSIEESDDSGTSWYKVYDFPRITTAGIYRSPLIRAIGNRVRYVQNVGGVSPSFTRSVNRLQVNSNCEQVRQLIDRSISLATLNSVTPSLDARHTVRIVQLLINVGAITTTAPAVQMEASDDNGSSWYLIGSPLTAVANSTVQTTVTNQLAPIVRARVVTEGVGVTLGYVLIKALG